MIVLFVNYVEECLQLTVACNRKQDHVAATKVEGTFVDQQLLIVADGQRRLVLAYWFTNEWRRCIRIVRHVSFGHFDFCLLYTSNAADERSSVDLGGRR